MNAATLQILGADKEGPVGGDQDFACSPVIFHDSGGRLMGVSGVKTGFFYAYHLDNVSAGPVWERDIGVTIGAAPAYDSSLGPSGTLFLIGVQAGSHQQTSEIHAVDPNTGADVWTAPVAVVGPVANNIAIAGRLIFVNAGAGGLMVLDETTGALLRILEPANAGPSASGVAVAEGTVYWVSGSYLNAWRPNP
jgi:outer membrane protein assembly factor BamB